MKGERKPDNGGMIVLITDGNKMEKKQMLIIRMSSYRGKSFFCNTIFIQALFRKADSNNELSSYPN
jgi:hypothetical protein